MKQKRAALAAVLSCAMLLCACGDSSAEDSTGFMGIPDSRTIRNNLEKNGYSFTAFPDTTDGGNELISAYRGEEPPDFAAFMMVRAETADDLLNDAEPIRKINETLKQYKDARAYQYLDDETYGNVYIYCTEGALKDAGISIAD